MEILAFIALFGIANFTLSALGAAIGTVSVRLFHRHPLAASLPIRLFFDYLTASVIAAYVVGAFRELSHGKFLFGFVGTLVFFFEFQKRLGSIHDQFQPLRAAGIPHVADLAAKRVVTELAVSVTEWLLFVVGLLVPAFAVNLLTAPVIAVFMWATMTPVVKIVFGLAGVFFILVTLWDAVLYSAITLGGTAGFLSRARQKMDRT